MSDTDLDNALTEAELYHWPDPVHSEDHDTLQTRATFELIDRIRHLEAELATLTETNNNLSYRIEHLEMSNNKLTAKAFNL
jgi:hypothetical protein